MNMESLRAAAAAAQASERATGVPALLSLAQWALESGWGEHAPGHNCFGIKAYKGCYGVQTLMTLEESRGVKRPVPQDFATFPALDACFVKHALLIAAGKPYLGPWKEFQKHRDAERLAREIAPIYATDSRYAEEITEMMRHPRVREALSLPEAA